MWNFFLDTFFTSTCFHCGELCDQKVLCAPCTELLELLPLEGRCPICFETYANHPPHCSASGAFLRSASAFSDIGPAATLIRALSRPGAPFLADSLAGYLVLQWSKLGWNMPDGVVAFTEKKSDLLLARAVARILAQPLLIFSSKIHWSTARAFRAVEGKTLLMVMGAHHLKEMRKCALELADYHPAAIEALTLVQ